MKLFYDRLSQMFILDTPEGVESLGGIVHGGVRHAILKLKEFGLTEAQARGATLQAVFNMGDSVCLEMIKKIV